jgi:pimeloyl-ACP methyl ester carboxylesterase
MNSSTTHLPTPTGPASVSGAPGLPAGFTDTFTSRYVQTGDLRQHVVIGGDGPPLVLVHGWPQTWYAWRKVMPALAEHFTVIAPDQRGIGLTDKPDHGYDSATTANDLVALMDALGFDRFAIYGTDIGLPIAYAVAADHPARVERLIVSEAPLPGVSPSPPLFVPQQLNAKFWHLMFNQLPAEVNEALVRGREDVFFGAEFDASAGTNKLPADVVDYYVDILRSDPDALRGSFGMYRALPASSAQNEQRKTRRLTMPVLAIGGAESAGAGIGNTMKLVADDVQTAVLPGAGHWVAETGPREATRRADRVPRPLPGRNDGRPRPRRARHRLSFTGHPTHAPDDPADLGGVILRARQKTCRVSASRRGPRSRRAESPSRAATSRVDGGPGGTPRCSGVALRAFAPERARPRQARPHRRPGEPHEQDRSPDQDQARAEARAVDPGPQAPRPNKGSEQQPAQTLVLTRASLSHQVDVLLDGLDHVLVVAAERLLGEAQREALRLAKRHVRRKAQRIRFDDRVQQCRPRCGQELDDGVSDLSRVFDPDAGEADRVGDLGEIRIGELGPVRLDSGLLHLDVHELEAAVIEHECRGACSTTSRPNWPPTGPSSTGPCQRAPSMALTGPAWNPRKRSSRTGGARE